MNLHTTTSTPIDDEYAALLGKAVYVFAYYEWTIIYIIDHLSPGFVHEYCRNNKQGLTAGAVSKNFEKLVKGGTIANKISTFPSIKSCQTQFDDLVKERNALIHAHPLTDEDGAQILGYQAHHERDITDMIWQKDKVENVISKFDAAVVDAGTLLQSLRESAS